MLYRLPELSDIKWTDSEAWSHSLNEFGYLRVHCRKSGLWVFTSPDEGRSEIEHETRDQAKREALDYLNVRQSAGLIPATASDLETAMKEQTKVSEARERVDQSIFHGEHILEGVESTTIKRLSWLDDYEDVEALRFRVDGVDYEAVKNPSDGYRSSLDGVYLASEPMSSPCEPIRVVGRDRPNEGEGYSYEKNDIIDFIRASDGKTVLSFGTCNVDDYYPGCVLEFDLAPTPQTES